MAAADVEAVDFAPEEDDLMDEDGVADGYPRTSHPKLKSAITGAGGSTGGFANKKTKGRGFREDADAERNSRMAARDFESLDSDGGPGPARWLLTRTRKKKKMGLFANSQGIWGWLFVAFGLTSFGLFLYAAVISKVLPPSNNPLISAIQTDRYYCFLVPLSLPILVVAVYFHWLSMKLFKHA